MKIAREAGKTLDYTGKQLWEQRRGADGGASKRGRVFPGGRPGNIGEFRYLGGSSSVAELIESRNPF